MALDQLRSARASTPAQAILILGSRGGAAAGVLMTVTGTTGGLWFAASAGGDRSWPAGCRAALGVAYANDG